MTLGSPTTTANFCDAVLPRFISNRFKVKDVKTSHATFSTEQQQGSMLWTATVSTIYVAELKKKTLSKKEANTIMIYHELNNIDVVWK